MGKRIERKIVAKVIGSVPGQTAGDSGAWKVVVYFSHQIVDEDGEFITNDVIEIPCKSEADAKRLHKSMVDDKEVCITFSYMEDENTRTDEEVEEDFSQELVPDEDRENEPSGEDDQEGYGGPGLPDRY